MCVVQRERFEFEAGCPRSPGRAVDQPQRVGGLVSQRADQQTVAAGQIVEEIFEDEQGFRVGALDVVKNYEAAAVASGDGEQPVHGLGKYDQGCFVRQGIRAPVGDQLS